MKILFNTFNSLYSFQSRKKDIRTADNAEANRQNAAKVFRLNEAEQVEEFNPDGHIIKTGCSAPRCDVCNGRIYEQLGKYMKKTFPGAIIDEKR